MRTLTALTPGPFPISRPHPRRERGDKKKPEEAFFSLAFLPSPGEGWGELGEGPGVRALCAYRIASIGDRRAARMAG